MKSIIDISRIEIPHYIFSKNIPNKSILTNRVEKIKFLDLIYGEKDLSF